MSIKRKITILFIISLFLMLSITFFIEKSNSKKSGSITINRYMLNANELLFNLSEGDMKKLKESIKGLNYIEKQIDTKKAETIFYKDLTFGDIKILKNGDFYYLYMSYLDNKILLYDTFQDQIEKDRIITLSLLFLDIFSLIVIYLIVLKIFSPLKTINQSMQKFSDGELSKRVDIKTGDEIEEVANNFNIMAQKVENTLKSKEELLRDIGHELKTPIVKGNFLIQKIEDKRTKESLKVVFDDMDRLISNILQIKLLDEEKLQIKKFKLSTLIANSLSKLLIDENDIDIEIEEDFYIEADLHYISLALKNLIENGLKYKSDGKVVIKSKSKEIIVSTKGKKLDNSLKHYTKPFIKKSNRSKGYGLGLSIVEKIIEKHGFTLNYFYKDGYNSFCIKNL